MIPLMHSRGAFCNTFDLHLAIIGLENQFLVFLRVAVLHRFYCNFKSNFHFGEVYCQIYGRKFSFMSMGEQSHKT